MGFTYSNTGVGSNTLSVSGGYQIVYDSGIGIVEANPETGPTATVQFAVNDANQRYNFVQQLLGYPVGTPPTIVYSGPYEYPPSPNLVCTAVTEIKTKGKWLPMALANVGGGPGLPWMFGKSAYVTAVFTRPPWQPLTSGGYFSIQYQSAGEYLTLPNTTYQFGDGTPTNTPIGLHVSQQNIIVTRYRMPFLPDAQAMPLLDNVNAFPFAIGWNVYNTGTLLFGGMNNDVTSDPFGNIIFTVQYLFQYRSVPWNYDFHPNRTTGWAIVTDGNGNPRYASANFNVLP